MNATHGDPNTTSPSSAAGWSARRWRWHWHRLGLRIALVEAVPPAVGEQHPSFDERTTALANGTVRAFRTLGVWAGMEREAAPIRKIHVSDQGSVRHRAHRRGRTRARGARLRHSEPSDRCRALGRAGAGRRRRHHRPGTRRSTTATPTRGSCEYEMQWRAARVAGPTRRRGRRRALRDPRPGRHRGGPHRIRTDRDHGDAHDAALPRFRRVRTLHRRRSDRDPAIAGRSLRHGLDTAAGRGGAPARVARRRVPR